MRLHPFLGESQGEALPLVIFQLVWKLEVAQKNRVG